MPVPSSGAISLNQFHIEAGGTSGTQCSINDSDIRALISKGSGATMSFSEWYGASSGPSSFSRTLSAARFQIIVYQYVIFLNTDYRMEVFQNSYNPAGSNNTATGTTSQFIDSAGNIQTLVQVEAWDGFKGPAAVQIELLGHNAGNNWTLSYMGYNVTPGSNFGNMTWQSSTNSTSVGANNSTHNVTRYSWNDGGASTALQLFNSTSSQSFSIT